MKNNVKCIFSCIFLLASCFSDAKETTTSASNPTIDSLLNVLKNLSSPSPEVKLAKGSDTVQINTLNLLGGLYTKIGSYEEALKYAQQAELQAKKINFKKGISSSYNIIGFVHWNQGDYPKALENYFKALKIDEELEDKNGVARELAS